jgi:TolB-like protein/Tfp pilus assembly protein PilF
VDVTAQEIGAHLDRIEASSGFARAGRLVRFLRFVVDETLAGRGKQIKEYSIAIGVFGRPSSYDPQVDSLVRVQASLLRTRLSEYYSAEGRAETIRIEIPKGGYEPVIRRTVATAVPVPPKDRRRLAAMTVSAAIMLAVLCVWLLTGARTFRSNPDVSASVAVLPFEDLSPSGDQAYLCDGIAVELIHALSRVPGLRVVGRTSAFQYKGKLGDVRRIGKELGVRSVVEGSVRHEGSKLRVTVQLINTADGYHAWSAAYDRRADDLFAVEKEIAQAIADSLRPHHLGVPAEQEITPNPEAYRLYLTGVYWRSTPSPENLRKAINEFRNAIAADPRYAAAQAALAEAYEKLYYTETVPLEETAAIAKAAAAKAVALDERLSQGHEAAAIARLIEWDLPGAEREFHRALQLDPADVRTRYSYAQLCLNPARRHQEAIEQLRYARSLDPVARYLITELGSTYLMSGQFARAREEFQKSLALNPKALGTRTNLAATDAAQGRYVEAVARLEAVNAEGPGDPWIVGHLGYAYAKAGRTVEARRILATLTGAHPAAALHIAAVHAGLGETNQALDCLDRGLTAHSPSMLWLKTDFRFAGLRSEPRYVAQARRLP